MGKREKRSCVMWMPKDFTGDVMWTETKDHTFKGFTGEEVTQPCDFFIGTGNNSKGESHKGEWVTNRAALQNQLIERLGDEDEQWKDKMLSFVDGKLTNIVEKVF